MSKMVNSNTTEILINSFITFVEITFSEQLKSKSLIKSEWSYFTQILK